MSAYHSLIRLIVDGMTIDANNTNAPLLQLQGNVDYVKELLESALLGSTIVARDRTCATDVEVGQPVYFNTTRQQFEKALPRITTVDGELTPAESSYVIGLVLEKTASDKIDVLMRGLASLSLSAAVDGTPSAGLYYLSSQTAGKMTKTQQAVSVPVCYVLGPSGTSEYEVVVNADYRDILNAHRHYKFELVCEEAADNTYEGWLPADDSIFAGNAPANAVYGYNLSESAIRNVWPPVPLESAHLEWHRPGDAELMGRSVPVGTELPALVQFDENGIWWLSDCEGDTPWPVDYTPDDSCPLVPEARMILWFNKPVFWTANTAVLSLTPKTGSGLTVTCRGTPNDATTGHLEIDLDLDLSANNGNAAGYNVVKSVSGQSLTFGPVVEAVVAGSSNVHVASSLGNLPESGYAQGVCTITVDDSLVGSTVAVESVRLDGVTEEFHENVIGLGFTNSYETSYTGRLFVPPQAADDGKMALSFTFLGRSAGTIPNDAFTLTYRRIATGNATLQSLPTSDTAATLDTTKTLSTTDQYFTVQCTPFSVEPSDVVMFTLTRTDTTYAAQIQVIDQRGVLTAGS